MPVFHGFMREGRFPPPTDRPDWGIRVAYVRDPDGTLIGLFRSLS